MVTLPIRSSFRRGAAVRSARAGSVRPAALPADCLSKRARHFHARIALDLIAFLDVVVIFHADTALGSRAYLINVVLEALQGFQSALEYDHIIAQHANREVAANIAIDHHASCNRAEFTRAEHAAYLSKPD